MKLDLSGARSLRFPDPGKLDRLARVDAVVIVGSSCVGKTTVIGAIRHSELARDGSVDVPVRYLTRPPRDGDCLLENVHVSREEFQARVRAGTIAVHWDRAMEGDRTIQYGFERARPGSLPVYSANNALFATGSNLRPRGAFAHALFVGVHAPDEVRVARLRHRSPDLWRTRPEEVSHRLAETADSVIPHVHLLVDNHGALERVAPIELVRLLSKLVCNADSR